MFRSIRSLTALLILAFALPAVAQESEEDARIQQMVKEEVERQLAQRWTAGLNPNGGGLFVRSPDGKTLFRLYGYAQPQLTYTDEDNGTTFEETDFRVRRARIDFTVDYDDRYKLFLEYDGASSDGTALVEAWGQVAYIKGRHYLRFGKFITPFSTENLRSSRAMDTVERYLALNAMFGLPALDVQFGPMLWGYIDPGKKVSYSVGGLEPRRPLETREAQPGHRMALLRLRGQRGRAHGRLRPGDVLGPGERGRRRSARAAGRDGRACR